MCSDDDLRGGRFVVVVVVVVARLLMDAVGVNARATAKPVAARSNRIRFMSCSDIGLVLLRRQCTISGFNISTIKYPSKLMSFFGVVKLHPAKCIPISSPGIPVYVGRR